MRAFIGVAFRVCSRLALATLLLGTGGSAVFLANQASSRPALTAATGTASGESTGAEKVRRFGSDGVTVPPDVARNMGLRTAVASGAVRPIQVPPLRGCLALDSNALARVHSRFAGEVVEVGAVEGEGAPASPEAHPSTPRTLRAGDRIRKGDLLAVVWSKDLGEKKSGWVAACLLRACILSRSPNKPPACEDYHLGANDRRKEPDGDYAAEPDHPTPARPRAGRDD